VTTLGFSSLGLPIFGEDAKPVDTVLDALFEDGRYDLLELHLEAPLPPRVGRDAPLIGDDTRSAFRTIAKGASRRSGRVGFGVGGRFVLGPTKHEPSLVCADVEGRALRIRLLREALDLASDLESPFLVFLGGPSPDALAPGKHSREAWKLFEDGIATLLPHAEARGVVLAPEAHSRHVFATADDARRLKSAFSSKMLGLTADVVHLAITETAPLATVLEGLAPIATHVQLDNLTTASCRPGAPIVHTLLHEPGAVDVGGALAALSRGGYRGAVSVEFLRADAPEVDALTYCREIGAWLRSRLG
jgi:sugar phosphate isomerase/epimerase